MELISSLSNAKVKEARLLRQRKDRRPGSAFLIEGIWHVGEGGAPPAAGRLRLESIFYAPDLLESDYARRLVQAQEQAGLPCHAVSAAVFASLAEKDNPQGILAVGRPIPMLLSQLTPQSHPWLAALVSPQDPGDLGTILRTVDAAGASGLLLLEASVDAYHPSCVRASMGALFWHPPVTAQFDEFTAWAGRNGYTIYGTSAHDAEDYRQVERFQAPLVLLLGSERAGLSADQRGACQSLLRLPMKGRVTSLNLAVAAGILMYHVGERLEK